MNRLALRLYGRLPTRFFFELRHVPDPGPLTGQSRILPLQRQVDVRVGQSTFQRPDSALQLCFFINLFGLLHANHLSSATIPILMYPFLNRPAPQYPLLPSYLIEEQTVSL